MKTGAKSHNKNQGFTIVETMIVLAVTTAMFLIAVIYISGRQDKAMFLDAIHEVRSQIDQVMNQVSNGVYPSNNDYTCKATAGGLRLNQVAANASEQGTNSGCVYYGKVISFGVNGDNEAVRVDTAIGSRLAGGHISQSLGESQTRIVNGTPGSSFNTDNIDIGDRFKLHNGLTIRSMCSYDKTDGTICTPIAGVAIVTNPSNQIGFSADGLLKSGSINASVAGLPLGGVAGSPGVNQVDMYNLVAGSIGTKPPVTEVVYNPTNGILLCFASGTTDQSGLITIGSQARGLATELAIRNGKACGL